MASDNRTLYERVLLAIPAHDNPTGEWVSSSTLQDAFDSDMSRTLTDLHRDYLVQRRRDGNSRGNPYEYRRTADGDDVVETSPGPVEAMCEHGFAEYAPQAYAVLPDDWGDRYPHRMHSVAAGLAYYVAHDDWTQAEVADAFGVNQGTVTQAYRALVDDRGHPHDHDVVVGDGIGRCPECSAKGKNGMGYGGYHAFACPDCGHEWVESA